jgi:hypothetical protein
MGGVILALGGPALAVSVPLPPPGLMTVDAWGVFAEIFIEVEEEFEIGDETIPAGFVNGVAIGYTQSVPGPNGEGDFVLYRGASSSTVAAQTPPDEVLLVGQDAIQDIFTGSGDFEGLTRGRLYVGGIVQSISSSGESVSYLTGPQDSQADADVQLTFAVYNAHVSELELDASEIGALDQAGFLGTEFIVTSDDGIHLDIWADETVDAEIADAGGETRYLSATTAGTGTTPELPVRDTNGTLLVSPDDGTYYDREAAGVAWENIDFAGNPADDDEVFWSFVGNPETDKFKVTEAFSTDGEVITMLNLATPNPDDTLDVLVQGPSDIVDPAFGFEGQFIPGMSLAPAGKTNGGFGFGNVPFLLADGDYTLSGELEFGAGATGTYDSDPFTFTFQQGEPGSVGDLTQLQGELIVPEPVTMAGMFLGLGSLVGYVRKRRK